MQCKYSAWLFGKLGNMVKYSECTGMLFQCFWEYWNSASVFREDPEPYRRSLKAPDSILLPVSAFVWICFCGYEQAHIRHYSLLKANHTLQIPRHAVFLSLLFQRPKTGWLYLPGKTYKHRLTLESALLVNHGVF